MPNSKSAVKRLKTSAEASVRNRAAKSEITTSERKIKEALVSSDKDAAQAAFRSYCSVLDKAVKRGVIKRNTADRRKSAANARISKA